MHGKRALGRRVRRVSRWQTPTMHPPASLICTLVQACMAAMRRKVRAGERQREGYGPVRVEDRPYAMTVVACGIHNIAEKKVAYCQLVNNCKSMVRQETACSGLSSCWARCGCLWQVASSIFIGITVQHISIITEYGCRTLPRPTLRS